MPHGLTIDHEGNTWLTDVAMHQVSTSTTSGVDRWTKTGQYGFELILLRPISSHVLKTVVKRGNHIRLEICMDIIFFLNVNHFSE